MRDFNETEHPLNVRIRGFNETVASSGVFLTPGRDANLRKLEPGEVVCIYPHEPAYDVALTLINADQPILEQTSAAPTRPLRWPNPRLARWSSASFTPGKQSDREAKAKALGMIEELIASEAEQWARAQTQIDEVRQEREAEEERALQARMAQVEAEKRKRDIATAKRLLTLAQKGLREAAEELTGATDEDREELTAARDAAQAKVEAAEKVLADLEEQQLTAAAA